MALAAARPAVLPFGPVMIVHTVDEHGRTRFYLTAINVEFDRALLSEAILGELTGGPDQIDPHHFLPNQEFLHFLHWVLARHVASAPGFLAEAARQKTGHVYIIDQRTPKPMDAVPPEAIIGAIEIADEQPPRYVGSPQYAVLTVHGPTQLDPWLFARLVDELRALGSTTGGSR